MATTKTEQPKTKANRKLRLNVHQVEAIQPYLNALIRRYQEVAEKGETEQDDPLCRMVEMGKCYECPVFGEEARGPGHMSKPHKGEPVYLPGPWYHCEEVGFLPMPPKCIEDTRDGVTCGPKPDLVVRWGKGHPQAGQPRWLGRPTSRQQAKAWGAEMVAFLEGLRRG